MINERSYLTIQSWMRTELNLKGNELLVYAIIYGFSQTENQKFTGSLQYLADWCGATRQGVLKNLQSLLDKELIIKTEVIKNGVKLCEYSCAPFNIVEHPVQHSLTPVQHSLTNNIVDNIEENKISSKDEIYQKTSSSSTSQFLRSSSRKTVNDSIYIDKFLEMYNRLSLSTVRKLTDKRKKAIVKLYRNYTEDDIKQVMKNIQESDFLSGRSSDFQATIDWILKEDNFLKILEGKYQHSYSKGGASDMNRRSSGRTVEQKRQLRKDIENGKLEKF